VIWLRTGSLHEAVPESAIAPGAFNDEETLCLEKPRYTRHAPPTKSAAGKNRLKTDRKLVFISISRAGT